jgi:hypothetical protein
VLYSDGESGKYRSFNCLFTIVTMVTEVRLVLLSFDFESLGHDNVISEF